MVDLSPLINRRPVRVETLGCFHSPDPWHAGATTEWTISRFQLVSEAYAANRTGDLARAQQGSRWRLRIPQAIGLETAQGGWRLLPRMLQRLWESGELRGEILPALLYRIEPHLRRIDVRQLPTVRLLEHCL